jgi:hypothetical protein
MKNSITRQALFGSLVTLALGAPLAAVGDEGRDIAESDWLELVKGYKGATLGAELVDIKDDETGESQEVTVKIPKSAIRHPDEIEEVVVVGRRPDKPELPEPIDISYEWLDDYDNDNYGLVIRLGKNSRWPIRLYMNSDPGFVR